MHWIDLVMIVVLSVMLIAAMLWAGGERRRRKRLFREIERHNAWAATRGRKMAAGE